MASVLFKFLCPTEQCEVLTASGFKAKGYSLLLWSVGDSFIHFPSCRQTTARQAIGGKWITEKGLFSITSLFSITCKNTDQEGFNHFMWFHLLFWAFLHCYSIVNCPPESKLEVNTLPSQHKVKIYCKNPVLWCKILQLPMLWGRKRLKTALLMHVENVESIPVSVIYSRFLSFSEQNKMT